MRQAGDEGRSRVLVTVSYEIFEIADTRHCMNNILLCHLEEKREDIIFNISSFYISVPTQLVGTLCAQLLLQFYTDSLEILQML